MPLGTTLGGFQAVAVLRRVSDPWHRFHLCAGLSTRWNSRSGIDGVKGEHIYGKHTFEELPK